MQNIEINSIWNLFVLYYILSVINKLILIKYTMVALDFLELDDKTMVSWYSIEVNVEWYSRVRTGWKMP